jgi:exosortase E/protease (VPEID-CTERM system)
VSLQALSPVRPGLARTVAWIALVIVEVLTISWLYEVPVSYAVSDNPFTPVRYLIVWALVAAGAFAILVSSRPAIVLDAWRAAQQRHDWQSALLVNLVLFALLAAASAWVTATLAAEPAARHTVLMTTYGALLAATAVSLLRIDISLSAALRLAATWRNEIVVAATASTAVQLLSIVSTHAWEPMATATLRVSKALLDLYEPSVLILEAERVLRVGTFGVEISQQCSGYEGIALVSAFLAIYLWVFRDTLRFPRAFVLFPIAVPAIWLLNCVRIAALASLGAHVDPKIAVQGFHSQAGWIAFLLATFGIMALASRWHFIRREAHAFRWARPAEDRVMLAHLVPFMALMAASIAIAAAAPFDRHLYGLKVAAVAAALWAFREVYHGWTFAVSREAVLAGLLVGAAWIATDPDPGAGTLGPWLETLGPGLALTWLLVRFVGTVVAVPIAEELAFRGYLMRWIADRNFAQVPYAHLSLVAILVSSALFGAMHERWIAGTLAGGVFAFVMVRSKGISGPIAAHMAANALIAVWAIFARQWSLL